MWARGTSVCIITCVGVCAFVWVSVIGVHLSVQVIMCVWEFAYKQSPHRLNALCMSECMSGCQVHRRVSV